MHQDFGSDRGVLYKPNLCLCENFPVGHSAVVAGRSATGSIAKGNRLAPEVCWLLEDGLSSLECTFALKTPGKSYQRFKTHLCLDRHFCSCCYLSNACMRMAPHQQALVSQLQNPCSTIFKAILELTDLCAALFM